MVALRRVVARLLNMARPGRGEDALSREIGAHLALLVVVSLAASYVPARRAARLDPVSALRR